MTDVTISPNGVVPPVTSNSSPAAATAVRIDNVSKAFGHGSGGGARPRSGLAGGVSPASSSA